MASELFADWSVGDVFLCRSDTPLASASLFLLEGEVLLALLEVISMGSPGDGADIWMVGVGVEMGMIRFDVRLAWPSAGRGILSGLSVTVAIPSRGCKDAGQLSRHGRKELGGNAGWKRQEDGRQKQGGGGRRGSRGFEQAVEGLVSPHGFAKRTGAASSAVMREVK